MAIKKQLHQPIHNTHQLPVVTGATSCFCSSESGWEQDMYYLSGSNFYKWDKVSKSAIRIASPLIAPVTLVSMRYTAQRWYHARVISATSTTVTIWGLRWPVLSGKTMRIDRGTWQWQERVLTYSSETVHDAGVITATSITSLGDSTKKWIPNQWAGYLVWITFGTDATQYKKILYNDTTTLYISDANLMPHDPWNNQYFVASHPYALPVTTAWVQAHYEIISTTYTVPSWTTTPDYSSFAQIKSGGIYLVSSAAATPFFNLQYYDVAHGSWQIKTVPQWLISAALGTDASIERLAKLTPYISSTATSATARSLIDTTQSMEVDRYRNFRILITWGTWIGWTRRIVSNTATGFYIERNWDITPDATSTFEIHNDYRKVILAGGALAQMNSYNPEYDFWAQWEFSDYGIANNAGVRLNGWEAIGITTWVRIAAWVTWVSSSPTAWWTLYTIGDILTCSVWWVGAQVIVRSIAPGGIVTWVELLHSGTTTGFTVGTWKATTWGTWTLCTINITSVWPTVLVTTSTAHIFKAWNVVTVSWCTDALYNTNHTILWVNSTTQFSISTTAAASMWAASAQSTTTIVDSTQNWIVNEHAWKLVHLMVAWLTPTSQIRWIISNTATTLTVATITAWTSGTSKYVIYDSKIFGVDSERKPLFERGYWHASWGSTTTLIDSSKNWIPNKWAWYRFRIDAGTGLWSGLITVISNTETTLTYATQSFTPDSTTMYEIQDCWGLLTASTTTSYTEATTKNWWINQWAWKRFKLTWGLGVWIENTCLSNTATAITIAAAWTAWDVTTPYAILWVPIRWSGIELIHINWSSDANTNWKLMFSPRGSASNTADIYNINTWRWTYWYFFSPQWELPTTWTSYAYDGWNYIYFSIVIANDLARIMVYDITTNKVFWAAILTNLDSTATIWNKMEIYTEPTGNKILFIGLNSLRLAEEILMTHLY